MLMVQVHVKAIHAGSVPVICTTEKSTAIVDSCTFFIYKMV